MSSSDLQIAATASFALVLFAGAAWWNVRHYGRIGNDPWILLAVVVVLGAVLVIFGEE